MHLRLTLLIAFLWCASCSAATPLFLGSLQDYMTNGGGQIIFVFSNRVVVVFNKTNSTMATYGEGYFIETVTGTGGANTNFNFQARKHYWVNGFTNVSVRSITGTSLTTEDEFSLTITNLSGQNNTLEFSPVTNSWHWSLNQGAPPGTLTNGFGIRVKGDTISSNFFGAWAIYAIP